MLVPAGLLITLLLGGIAFDLSLLFLRQRQASSVAVDLANDLATLALDEGHLRATGEYVLDPARAGALATALLRESDVAADAVGLTVQVTAPDSVSVTVTLDVDYVFAKAIPGAADGTEVSATASALAVAG
ncbi:MAG TPA: hypothetical protein VFV32_13855 [Acidimicrobiales bacterium]|jgi:hypothetical protein|nr:hypothetical protein [Acidimicrobiales bacterium]